MVPHGPPWESIPWLSKPDRYAFPRWSDGNEFISGSHGPPWESVARVAETRSVCIPTLERWERVHFWFPRSSVGIHTLGCRSKIGMHSHAGTMGTSTFLVPTVLRGNPYLVCRSKIGMHSHAGAMGTSTFLVPTVLRGNPYLGLPKQDRYAFPRWSGGNEEK